MAGLPKKLQNKALRKNRVRAKISGTAERPRLTVTISNKHVSAQIIDDVKQHLREGRLDFRFDGLNAFCKLRISDLQLIVGFSGLDHAGVAILIARPQLIQPFLFLLKDRSTILGHGSVKLLYV